MCPPKIKIAKTLSFSEIEELAKAGNQHIIDMRTCLHGMARPIEENILKQICFWHMSYEQAPDQLEVTGQKETDRLLSYLDHSNDGQVILTDDVKAVCTRLDALSVVYERNQDLPQMDDERTNHHRLAGAA